jgi:hypothetical protein
MISNTQFAIMAKGVWVAFEKKPDILDIQEARRLLDQLTDELIKERFDEIDQQTRS